MNQLWQSKLSFPILAFHTGMFGNVWTSECYCVFACTVLLRMLPKLAGSGNIVLIVSSQVSSRAELGRIVKTYHVAEQSFFRSNPSSL